MKLIEFSHLLRRELAALRGERIALVATMGCLHDGHISLIRKAKKLADVVVVSIYVNPLQFSPNDDLNRYPRPFAEDARRCRAEGVDILFHPTSLFDAAGPAVNLHVQGLDECLCGKFRIGHFNGVLTVVNLLFNTVQPDMAIFGEKDWQQLTIIRRMTHDLNMPVEIVAAAIVREADGLAMSSRNRYLSSTERQQAGGIYQALTRLKQHYQAGENEAVPLLAAATAVLRKHGLHAEYLELRDSSTLETVSTVQGNTRAFIAVPVGNTRLIDNLSLIGTV